METVDLRNFLIWLASGVGGLALAHVLENWPWFAELESQPKFLSVLGVSLVLPPLGVLGLYLFYGDPLTANSIFVAVVSGLTVFAASQREYLAIKKARTLDELPVAELQEIVPDRINLQSAPDSDLVFRTGRPHDLSSSQTDEAYRRAVDEKNYRDYQNLKDELTRLAEEEKEEGD